VTSQHPYAEDFISEPHVYTVDINNMTEVEAAVKKALKMSDRKKVPTGSNLVEVPNFFNIQVMN